jgi:diadenosine tetraphosphate (Ap4A) HIT family hydrolase
VWCHIHIIPATTLETKGSKFKVQDQPRQKLETLSKKQTEDKRPEDMVQVVEHKQGHELIPTTEKKKKAQ